MNRNQFPRATIQALLTLGGLGAGIIILCLVTFGPVAFIAIAASPPDMAWPLLRWFGPAFGYLILYVVVMVKGANALDGRVISSGALVFVAAPVVVFVLMPFIYPVLREVRFSDPHPPAKAIPPAPLPDFNRMTEPSYKARQEPLSPAPPLNSVHALSEKQQFERRDRIQDCIRETFSQWQQQQNPLPSVPIQSARIKAIAADCEKAH